MLSLLPCKARPQLMPPAPAQARTCPLQILTHLRQICHLFWQLYVWLFSTHFLTALGSLVLTPWRWPVLMLLLGVGPLSNPRSRDIGPAKPGWAEPVMY